MTAAERQFRDAKEMRIDEILEEIGELLEELVTGIRKGSES